MAGNNILTYVLLGGAAYLGWNWWQSQQTAAVVPVPPVPPANPPAGTPPSAPAAPPPSTLAACGGTGQPVCTPALTFALMLNALAGGSGASKKLLTLDQWSYYYNGLGNTTPLTDAQFGAMMTAAGITAATRGTVTMDASQYTALLAGIGVAGLSGYRGLGGRGYMRAPVGAYGMGQFTMADFRRAGRR